MIPAAFYGRFSDDNQSDGYSIEGQLDAVQRWADTRGYKIVKNYIDRAKSGRTTAGRDEYERMIYESRYGEFKVVIVWALDRFARNMHDHMRYEHKLNQNDVQLLSVTQSLDPKAKGYATMKGVLIGMAEDRSREISEDTFRGMMIGAKEGFWQNGAAPFGYKLKKVPFREGEKNKLEIERNEALVVKMIFDLYKRYGRKEIAARINMAGYRTRRNKLFSNTSVQAILDNPVYTGTLIFNREGKHGYDPVIVKDAFPPIIGMKDFDEKMLVANQRKKGAPVNAMNYMLSSILVCGECGKNYVGVSGTGRNNVKYRYYKCNTKVKSGVDQCSSKSLKAGAVEIQIYRELKKQIMTEENIATVIKEIMGGMHERFARCRSGFQESNQKYENAKGRYEKLLDAIETGMIDAGDVGQRLKTLKETMDQLSLSREKMAIDYNMAKESLNLTPEGINGVYQAVYDAMTNIDAMNNSRVRDFIEKITVNGNNLTVYWRYPETPALIESKEEESTQLSGEWLPGSAPIQNALQALYEYRFQFEIELDLAA